MNELARVLASFDDDALVALASKGLLRRAYKDVEQGVVTNVEVADDGVRLTVSEFTVTMPMSGPASASCSCPATSCCRHILAAALHLKASGSPEATTEEPLAAKDELLTLTSHELSKWAGKAAVRGALKLLEDAAVVVVEERDAVLVRFPGHNVDCRYFAGGGLEGMVVSAPERQRKKLAVAAVLAYQQHHGATPAVAVPAAPKQVTSGAPRSREEVLATTQSLLEEMIHIGLAHLSSSVLARLTTLSVSALGVHLPRLSRTLRRLAEQVDLLLRRNAQASEETLFQSLARCFALTQAMASDPENAELVGRYRSQYRETLDLELMGVGAYRWRTSSGYRGLTALFWSPAQGRLYSWSDSRPLDRDFHFDPQERYRAMGPWASRASLEEMLGRSMRLSAPKANEHDRLSSAGSSKVELREAVELAVVDFGERAFESWKGLRDYATSIYAVGLQVPHELDPIVVLAPSGWGRQAFDPTTQTFNLELLDGDDDVLPVRIVYNDWNDLVIRRLENTTARRATKRTLLARIVYVNAQVAVYPLAMFEAGIRGRKGLTNLTLDPMPESGFSRWLKRVLKEATTLRKTAAFESIVEEAGTAPWSPATEREISTVESDLLHLAESGRHALTKPMAERLSERATALRRVGFPTLAEALEPMTATNAIKVKYLCQLHRQAAIKAALSR